MATFQKNENENKAKPRKTGTLERMAKQLRTPEDRPLLVESVAGQRDCQEAVLKEVTARCTSKPAPGLKSQMPFSTRKPEQENDGPESPERG